VVGLLRLAGASDGATDGQRRSQFPKINLIHHPARIAGQARSIAQAKQCSAVQCRAGQGRAGQGSQAQRAGSRRRVCCWEILVRTVAAVGVVVDYTKYSIDITGALLHTVVSGSSRGLAVVAPPPDDG
jgi:hypothetical protein